MSINPENTFDFRYNINTDKRLDHFWFGIVIYMAAFVLSTTTVVNYIVCQGFQVLGLIFILSAAIRLVKWEFDNNYLKILYSLYCLWLFFVIVRGFVFDIESFKSMLFDADFGLLPYFAPIILLFPKGLKYYKNIFNVILFLGVLFLLYDILFYNNLMNLDYDDNNTKFTFEFFTKYLSIPCGFILLTFNYHSNRRKVFALLVILVSVTFSIIRARRALLFMSLSPLIAAYALYFLIDKKKIFNFFLAFVFGLMLLNIGLDVYNKNPNGVFNLLTERIDQDTRSGVEDCFYKDMSTNDWIIGKGMNGKYFCPGVDVDDRTGYRRIIETDYLNIILKGGIISLVLLILILVPAIIKGLFYSKNLLSKAAGFWIFLWLVDLYPANVYAFSLNHLLVWISIGICYSEKIRNISESQMKNYFLSRTY